MPVKEIGQRIADLFRVVESTASMYMFTLASERGFDHLLYNEAWRFEQTFAALMEKVKLGSLTEEDLMDDMLRRARACAGRPSPYVDNYHVFITSGRGLRKTTLFTSRLVATPFDKIIVAVGGADAVARLQLGGVPSGSILEFDLRNPQLLFDVLVRLWGHRHEVDAVDRLLAKDNPFL